MLIEGEKYIVLDLNKRINEFDDFIDLNKYEIRLRNKVQKLEELYLEELKRTEIYYNTKINDLVIELDNKQSCIDKNVKCIKSIKKKYIKKILDVNVDKELRKINKNLESDNRVLLNLNKNLEEGKIQYEEERKNYINKYLLNDADIECNKLLIIQMRKEKNKLEESINKNLK